VSESTTRPADRVITAELLATHDRPGPRYTSYPTAVEFTEDVGREEYHQQLAATDALPGAPLSVYVHLPFCDERCTFCGCHVITSPDHDRATPYLDALRGEIDLVAERLPDRRGIAQLHLGGGTPTYFSPAQLGSLLDHFFTRFRREEGAELAIECDPRVTTEEHLRALADRGFNRISFGVQDFTPEVQEAIGRVQTLEETAALMSSARRCGFGGINVDLIYGLPRQRPETFEASVEQAIALSVDRAAVYSFAYVPWIRGHQKQLDEAELPSREAKYELFAIARERFLAAGYAPIGMDHFALPGDDLARARQERRLRRNFQGYTVIPAEDVIGLGISAIGDLRGAYVQNAKKLSRYNEALAAGQLPVERGVLLSRDDELRRAVIGELMCNFHLDKRAIEERFGVVLDQVFAVDLERLQPLAREGLARLETDSIGATPTGELFIRNLAMCFDTYWREKHEGGEQPVFSRTV